MNQVRRPSEFLYGFQCSFTEECSSQSVVIITFFLLIMKNVFSFEKVFIIEKINLQPCIRKRSNLDLQWIIIIIHRYIDSRQTNHFVQTMTSLIDYPKTGHNTSNFKPTFICL